MNPNPNLSNLSLYDSADAEDKKSHGSTQSNTSDAPSSHKPTHSELMRGQSVKLTTSILY
jgi:hypothetical protein